MHAAVSSGMSAEQFASALERSATRPQTDAASSERALETAIEVLRLREQRSQEESRFCADIEPSRLAEADRWLYLSATRGNLLAIDTLISGMLMVSPDLLDNLDLLQRFRNDAPVMVESALRQGTDMIRVLAGAHAGLSRRIGLLEQALEPDPVVAHALIKLEALEAMRNAGQGSPNVPDSEFANLLPEIDPVGQARADALAEQWFAAREQHRLARRAAYARAGISPEERSKDPCLR
jgi:hypothetical protein